MQYRQLAIKIQIKELLEEGDVEGMTRLLHDWKQRVDMLIHNITKTKNAANTMVYSAVCMSVIVGTVVGCLLSRLFTKSYFAPGLVVSSAAAGACYGVDRMTCIEKSIEKTNRCRCVFVSEFNKVYRLMEYAINKKNNGNSKSIYIDDKYVEFFCDTYNELYSSRPKLAFFIDKINILIS